MTTTGTEDESELEGWFTRLVNFFSFKFRCRICDELVSRSEHKDIIYLTYLHPWKNKPAKVKLKICKECANVYEAMKMVTRENDLKQQKEETKIRNSDSTTRGF